MTLFRNYWFPQEDRLLQQFTKIVGAVSPQELCLVSTLTVNLHVALSTFYRPLQTERKKIMIIYPEFSSDVFAIQSWLTLYAIKDGLIEVNVEDVENANDNIIAEIEKSKDQIQVLSFSAVNYVTGQFYDVPRIVQTCKKYNIICILQCAHAIGSVELKLHDWEVDCAVWCSYKYLNCC